MRSPGPLSGLQERIVVFSGYEKPPAFARGEGAQARWGGCALGNNYEEALVVHQANSVDDRERTRKPVHAPEATCAVLPSRYWWTCWMTTDPSPTADATRLTDCARTSPTANTPGTVVSNISGGRSSLQPVPA